MQGHEKTKAPHPKAHEAFESGFHAYDTTGSVLLGKRRHKQFFADALGEKTTFEKRVIFPLPKTACSFATNSSFSYLRRELCLCPVRKSVSHKNLMHQPWTHQPQSCQESLNSISTYALWLRAPFGQ
jgi:hypothetical protein